MNSNTALTFPANTVVSWLAVLKEERWKMFAQVRNGFIPWTDVKGFLYVGREDKQIPTPSLKWSLF